LSYSQITFLKRGGSPERFSKPGRRKLEIISKESDFQALETKSGGANGRVDIRKGKGGERSCERKFVKGRFRKAARKARHLNLRMKKSSILPWPHRKNGRTESKTNGSIASLGNCASGHPRGSSKTSCAFKIGGGKMGSRERKCRKKLVGGQGLAEKCEATLSEIRLLVANEEEKRGLNVERRLAV